jgi:hypothetical protein
MFWKNRVKLCSHPIWSWLPRVDAHPMEFKSAISSERLSREGRNMQEMYCSTNYDLINICLFTKYLQVILSQDNHSTSRKLGIHNNNNKKS